MKLTLVHLYPREMNIYGDTGNVLVLRRRLQWRGIDAEVVPVAVGDRIPSDADVILGGGGQDAAQGDIGADFLTKGPTLAAMAADGVVMLAICGTYQMLGHEFLTKDGARIAGTGVLDLTTTGSPTRLIGNHIVDTEFGRLAGYENHSGLTDLGAGVVALGRTVPGRGNNGRDRTEGAVRGNVFGTYLHGPVLAKSPRFADELLRRALARRGAPAGLAPVDGIPVDGTPVADAPLADLPLADTLADAAALVAAGRPR